MFIDQIKTRRRNEFPALNKPYMNYGGQGPLSSESLDAINRSYREVQAHGPFSGKTIGWMLEEFAKTRAFLALELGGDPQSFVLTQNATEGCNIVLWGIDWQAGDHLVTTDCEHPGVMAAIENVAKRHELRVTTVSLLTEDSESIGIVQAIGAAIESRTKLVVLSHVLWNTGETLPLAEIQACCRSANVPLLVDGAQSAGVIALDFSNQPIDYYAFPGHKWFCGPEGLGALYIRPELIPELKQTFVGWRSSMFVENPDTSAVKFEVATAPFPLLAGLRAAIEGHRRWGDPQERYQQILTNVRNFRTRLSELSFVTVLSPQLAPSGLVSFMLHGLSHSEVGAKLEADEIILRTIPQPDCMRASIHYLTEESDMDALVQSLTKLKSASSQLA